MGHTRARYPWKKWSDGEWHDTGVGRDREAEARLRAAANVYGWRNGVLVEFDVTQTPYHELTEEEQAVARFEGLPRVVKVRVVPRPEGRATRASPVGRGRKTSSYDHFVDTGLWVACFPTKDERRAFRLRLGAWAWQRGYLVASRSYTVTDANAGMGHSGHPIALRFQVRSSENEPLSPLLTPPHRRPDVNARTHACNRCGVRTDDKTVPPAPADPTAAVPACDGCGRVRS